MIKAVIFDLDGTLLHRDESVSRFISGQYDRLIKHVPKDHYITRFLELDNRGYVWKDKVYQQLVAEFNLHMPWEELLQDYLAHFKESCVPFPNLLPMLEELKRASLKLGIITNGRGQFQMDNIKALGIADYFESILISEWEGLKKPDPAIFQRALAQLQVSPDECIFVGDHPENDVKAAQRVGMFGIWKRDSHWGEVDADLIIDDLEELPWMFKQKYTCPCCGYLTLDAEPPGTFDICPICFWEDDNIQFDDPDYDGGANKPSLREAQKNFADIGACEKRCLEFVRKPHKLDKKAPNWKPLAQEA